MKPVRIYLGDEAFSDKLSKDIWTSPDKFVGQLTVTVSPELFTKIFTKERLRILKALEKSPESVNELVAVLDRPREAVSRDLSYLSAMGIINLEKNGKERIPTRASEISITI